MQNTIEQSFIFVGLFTYFLFDGASNIYVMQVRD